MAEGNGTPRQKRQRAENQAAQVAEAKKTRRARTFARRARTGEGGGTNGGGSPVDQVHLLSEQPECDLERTGIGRCV